MSDPVEKRIWSSPGGKSFLAKKLAGMFPEHRVYIEPFVGSGAVFFAKEAADVEIINDADPDIARAFKIVKGLDDKDLATIDSMDWVSAKKTYDAVIKSDPKTDLEWLYKFLYLSRFSYSRKRGAGYDTLEAGRRAGIPDRVRKHKDRLGNTVVLNKGYEEVIKEHDAEDAVLFLDPPYAGHDVGIGETKFDETEFFNVLKGIKGKFVLTYGVRGELPRMIRKDGSFTVKKLRTPHRAANMKGGDRADAVFVQLLVTNFSVDVEKALGPDVEVSKPFPHEHAARQHDPTKGHTFRRFHPKGWPVGLDAILEISEGRGEIQSVRADKERWSVGAFRNWLKKHGFSTSRVEAAEVSKAVESASDVQREDLPPAAYAAPFYESEDGSYDPEKQGKFVASRSKLPHHVNTAKSPTEDTSVDLTHLRAARQRFDQADWSDFGSSAAKVKRAAMDDLAGHARRLLSSSGAGVEKTVEAACMDASDASLVATLQELLSGADVTKIDRQDDPLQDVVLRAGELLLKSSAYVIAKSLRPAEGHPAVGLSFSDQSQRIMAAGAVAKMLRGRLPEEASNVGAALEDVVAFSKAIVEIVDPVDFGDLVGEETPEVSEKSSFEVSILKSGPEGKYALGIVLEPNDQEAGLDPDAQDDIYSEEEVRKAFEHYTTNSYGNLDLMHDGKLLRSDQVVLLDNWTTPVAFEVDGKPVKKGAWLQGIGVLDPEIQMALRSGKLRAYSVAGRGVRTEETVST